MPSKWLSRVHRPSYPIAAEKVLGGLLVAWGVWALTGNEGSKAWHWASGYFLIMGVFAICLGVFKFLCAQRYWVTPGRWAALVAAGVWFQFGCKTQEVIFPTPSMVAIYYGLAAASIAIFASKRPLNVPA